MGNSWDHLNDIQNYKRGMIAKVGQNIHDMNDSDFRDQNLNAEI